MDRKRNIGNRNNPGRIGRRNRNRTLRRRPLRLVRPNRNRLSRVQNNINRNRLGLGFNRRRRFNNFRRRINNNIRIIFVGNLPYNISTRDLRKLFRPEGFINTARVVTGPLEEESLYNIEEEGEIILKVLIIIKEIINLEEIEEASDQEEEDIKKGINA